MELAILHNDSSIDVPRLSTFSSKKFSGETFPRKLEEMQNTFALSNFEIEVLTVLALVSNDRLTMIDDHNRRSDENDKAVFVAKCLDCDVAEVMAVLDCKEKLRRYNCVDSDFDFNRQLFKFLNGVFFCSFLFLHEFCYYDGTVSNQ